MFQKNSGKGDGLALQADGKIVLAGSGLDPAHSTQVFGAARFNTNGTADSTFGTGGVVKTLVGGADMFGGLTVQADGKIVVAGSETAVSAYPLYLVRYNTDGTLDNAFGSSGVVSLNPAGIAPTTDGVAVQSDGSIVVGGDMADSVTQQSAFFAVRVSPTGALDTGYGNGGWASADFIYGGGGARAIALQPDGALLVAGYMRSTTNLRPVDVALVRFLSSAPQIALFTANPNPASAGSSVTLSASNITDGNPNSTITQVAFYLDSNNDGTLEPGTDTLLDYATQTGPGVWTLTFSTSAMGLTAGNYKLFAQAEDSYGAFGDAASLDLQLS